MKTTIALRAIFFAACVAATQPAPAADMHEGHQDHAAPVTQASRAPSAAMTEGEVRKVDKENGKLTLRHGPIENLGMPGMTMVFRVADPAALDTFKAGDKVRFRAESDSGQLVVTEIRPAD